MNGLVKYRILLHPRSLTEWQIISIPAGFFNSNFSFCHYEPKGGEWFPWEWPHLTPCHVTCQNERNVFTSSLRFFIHPTAGFVCLHLICSVVVLQDMHLRIMQNAYMQCRGRGVHAIFGSFPMWNYHVSIKWGFLFAISDSTLSRWTETHPRCRGGIIPERFVWQGGGCNLTFSFSGELCF